MYTAVESKVMSCLDSIDMQSIAKLDWALGCEVSVSQPYKCFVISYI